MRVVRVGHAVFAVVLIALGIQGLFKGDFVVPWQPVPQGVPARELLIYLSGGVALAAGMKLSGVSQCCAPLRGQCQTLDAAIVRVGAA